jgi:hypothetical protein
MTASAGTISMARAIRCRAGGRIDDSLYVFRLTLVIGDGAIYMGPVRLPLDPASFSIRRLQSPGPGGKLALAWFSDKDGDLMVSSPAHNN